MYFSFAQFEKSLIFIFYTEGREYEFFEERHTLWLYTGLLINDLSSEKNPKVLDRLEREPVYRTQFR